MTSNHSQIRQYLINELDRDLVGPFSTDEELPETPVSRYLAGILYPESAPVDADEDQDAAEAASDDDAIDDDILLSAAINPSTMGLTFRVRSGGEITIAPTAAAYIKKTLESNEEVWQRKQLNLGEIPVTADEDKINKIDLVTGLRLFILVRCQGTICTVTVSLVNTHKITSEEQHDPNCFFQCAIRLESTVKNKAIFLPKDTGDSINADRDRLLNELLYRHAPEYAAGHGCAVDWDAEEKQNAKKLWTATIPSYELLQFSPDPEKPFRAQEMRFLAQADSEELIDELNALPALYRDWVSNLDIDSVPTRLRSVAVENQSECEEVARRLELGIELVANDKEVREAFQWANHAMLVQRARAVWLKESREGRKPEPVTDSQHKWRPFQLAFILLCLPSIANPENEYRDVVDLLWFPTGGGKTEAYLGLTAFTIFLRRLKAGGHPSSAGVAVLMRYTLRLLTIQQFQRAAILILACESIRRKNRERLGEDIFSLGLWVGRGATPNTSRQAKKALDDLLAGERVLEANPYQIHSCPWCGSKITPRDYRIAGTLEITCPDQNCEFNGILPLYLVDDDIYLRQPSLLIGTVDKFARLPWLTETAQLFGGVNKERLPPELIIQDELHLISGPLGTLVGLYETAIDILCEHENVLPKVIASTATIRKAAEQSRNLFNRDFAQFPPPGIDARDNFFSRQVPPSQRPGRCYLGVHASGRSMKTTLLRVYAVLLQRIHEHGAGADLRDPYWTLVGYFNSMRELGGTVRLVDDDVQDRMALLARRQGTKRRYINPAQELNSRIGSDEIPEILDYMSCRMDQNGCLDVLLATNMISVGVDVDRLGLMVVTGQPKMSSEYIQATSRVGRQFPGLVVTLYNWTRPRDRSHYERFTSYHSAIYSHVEPTSVTPFSSRARDRGLHAIVIALVRHLSPDMNPEDAAFQFESDSPLVQRVTKRIIERVNTIDPSEVVETRQELMTIIRKWDALASLDNSLSYGQSFRNPNLPHLMEAAENLVTAADYFPTLNSLRSVEGEAGVFIQNMKSRE